MANFRGRVISIMKFKISNLIAVGLVLGCGLFCGSAAFAQFQTDSQSSGQPNTPPAAQKAAQPAKAQEPPLTEKEVIQLVKKNKKDLQKISGDITGRGVAFDMTPEIQEKLVKAGATPEFVANVRNLGPTARASMATSTAGKGAVPPEEAQAFQAIQNELDPDRKIQEANDFATKYPNSILITYAYFLAQGAALQKDDLDGVLSYGEKSLASNPDNLNALMLMTKFLPQPRSLQNEVNPDKKLEEAEKDGQKALGLVETLPKMPNEPDDVFEKRKGQYLEAIHSGLGMVYLQRAVGGLGGVDPKELAKSETEYKAAVAASANPAAEDFFRLGEVLTRENKKDDAIQAFTKASELSQDNPQMKGLADQQIQQLKSQK
jgi:tetratricopeptide (TPR) repeat protein